MIAPATGPAGACVERIDTPGGGFWFGAAPDASPIAGWASLDDPPAWAGPPRPEWRLAARLRLHFQGRFDSFRDLPLPFGSPFFISCWRVLRESEPGDRWAYRDLAAKAGRAAAVRAAGAAMRRNPAPVLIPCHRVVAADGSLGGYAGAWGDAAPTARIKRFLLELEAAAGTGTPTVPGELLPPLHR